MLDSVLQPAPVSTNKRLHPVTKSTNSASCLFEMGSVTGAVAGTPAGRLRPTAAGSTEAWAESVSTLFWGSVMRRPSDVILSCSISKKTVTLIALQELWLPRTDCLESWMIFCMTHLPQALIAGLT